MSLKLESPEQSIANTLQVVAPHLTIHAQLKIQDRSEEVMVMIDSGATGNFIDTAYCSKLQIPVEKKTKPESVRAVDRTLLTSGPISHQTQTILLLFNEGDQRHEEELKFEIIDAPQFGIILGMPWLTLHNPCINWADRHVSFDSEWCIQECLGS